MKTPSAQKESSTHWHSHIAMYATSLCAIVIASSLISTSYSLSSSIKRASGVTSSPDAANRQTFDYIVVGAGLTGTTVAARLAENTALTILLVEAGGDDRNNPQVYDIYAYSQAFNGPLDWAWITDQNKVMHG